jgi:hypothetical protein
MTEKVTIRELQPAHPSDKFTMEEARAALREVEAEAAEKERRRAAREARKLARAGDRGNDP